MNPISAGGWGYCHLVTNEDLLWYDMGLRYHWRLPKPVIWWQRWPPFRQVRLLRAAWRAVRVERQLATVGLTPSGYDAWVIYAIKRGWI